MPIRKLPGGHFFFPRHYLDRGVTVQGGRKNSWEFKTPEDIHSRPVLGLQGGNGYLHLSITLTYFRPVRASAMETQRGK